MLRRDIPYSRACNGLIAPECTPVGAGGQGASLRLLHMLGRAKIASLHGSGPSRATLEGFLLERVYGTMDTSICKNCINEEGEHE
jgi:hypothetical protein